VWSSVVGIDWSDEADCRVLNREGTAIARSERCRGLLLTTPCPYELLFGLGKVVLGAAPQGGDSRIGDHSSCLC
jgi:hypothetical protein